jgi:hypothetical protein
LLLQAGTGRNQQWRLLQLCHVVVGLVRVGGVVRLQTTAMRLRADSRPPKQQQHQCQLLLQGGLEGSPPSVVASADQLISPDKIAADLNHSFAGHLISLDCLMVSANIWSVRTGFSPPPPLPPAPGGVYGKAAARPCRLLEAAIILLCTGYKVWGVFCSSRAVQAAGVHPAPVIIGLLHRINSPRGGGGGGAHQW